MTMILSLTSHLCGSRSGKRCVRKTAALSGRDSEPDIASLPTSELSQKNDGGIVHDHDSEPDIAPLREPEREEMREEDGGIVRSRDSEPDIASLPTSELSQKNDGGIVHDHDSEPDIAPLREPEREEMREEDGGIVHDHASEYKAPPLRESEDVIVQSHDSEHDIKPLSELKGEQKKENRKSQNRRSLPEELKETENPALHEMYPHHFDNRLSDTQRPKTVTSEQWQEHLDELKCALCGIPGGKCDCEIEEDTMTLMSYQKIAWAS